MWLTTLRVSSGTWFNAPRVLQKRLAAATSALQPLAMLPANPTPREGNNRLKQATNYGRELENNPNINNNTYLPETRCKLVLPSQLAASAKL